MFDPIEKIIAELLKGSLNRRATALGQIMHIIEACNEEETDAEHPTRCEKFDTSLIQKVWDEVCAQNNEKSIADGTGADAYEPDAYDLISKLMSLEKTGKYYSCCCPFHLEMTPSFSVKRGVNFWNCFGCGIEGDGRDFMRKMDEEFKSHEEFKKRLTKNGNNKYLFDR